MTSTRRAPVLSIVGLAALAFASCGGSDGPTLSTQMRAGAAAIAGVPIPTGWTMQSTSRSSNVTVMKVHGVALDVTASLGKADSVGWSAVSPTITSDAAAPTCREIAERIEAARVATGAAPLEQPFNVDQCTTTISPDNPAAATNTGRSIASAACSPIDATRFMCAATAIEGGSTDRQVLLQLRVDDRGN